MRGSGNRLRGGTEARSAEEQVQMWHDKPGGSGEEKEGKCAGWIEQGREKARGGEREEGRERRREGGREGRKGEEGGGTGTMSTVSLIATAPVVVSLSSVMLERGVRPRFAPVRVEANLRSARTIMMYLK